MAGKIFSITVVQNQDDIFGDVLEYHQKVFDDLYIWDIGSTDTTLEIIKTLASRYSNIHVWSTKQEKFSNDLRGHIFNDVRSKYDEDDWCYQLDSDEFLKSDLKKIIQNANKTQEDYIKTWHVNFQYTFTDKDNNVSSYKDLKYYLANFSEIRVYRNKRYLEWKINDYSMLPLGNILPGNFKKACSQRIIIYHYPFRSIAQLKKRVEQKLKLTSSEKFKEVQGINYDKYKVTEIERLMKNKSDCKTFTGQTIHISIKEKFNILYKTYYRPLAFRILNRFNIFKTK